MRIPPMQLPVDVLMDRYSPRHLLVYASLICVIGTYLFTSLNLGCAQAGRFLVGFGSAFAFVGVLKLAIIWLLPQRFALVAACTTTLGMLGGMFGDFIFSPLVAKMGWRDVIYYSALMGILVIILIWFFIPTKKEKHDFVPKMTFQQLLSELMLILKGRQIWLIGFLGFVLYLPISIFAELWGIPFLQYAYGLSKQDASHTISSIFLGWAIGGPLLGWLSDSLRNRLMPLLICSLLSIGTILIVLYQPSIAKNNLWLWLFAFGVFTSAQSIVFALARESNVPWLAGTALAMTNMLVMLGGVLFQPLVGFLLDFISAAHTISSNAANINVFSMHGFQIALSILPISILLGIFSILFIKETHARPLDVQINYKNENLINPFSHAKELEDMG